MRTQPVRALEYRPEIDGLRSIAVLPVIFYHAGFPQMPGGFLGVDVFFVISGYLISRLISTELGNGSFSLLRFYERRARRILPALFVVVAGSMVAAWFWMIPEQFAEFGESLIAVPLFVSNLLFWSQAGYFATDAGLNPLLHTWSLAVEEQFYLAYPLLLTGLATLGRRLVLPALMLSGVFSLALTEWTASRSPDTAFFLAHTRIWELFAGAVVAISGIEFARWGSRLREPLAVLGLILCATSFAALDDSMRNHAFFAATPVLGACLIIACGDRTTRVGRLLSLRPLVWTGLISYSLYLYHQPVFSFLRIAKGRVLEPWEFLGPILVCFGLSYLTWKFVEQPFRNRQTIATRWLMPGCALFTLVPIVAGVAAMVSGGFPSRISDDARRILQIMGDEYAERAKGVGQGTCQFNRRLVQLDQFIRDWRCLPPSDEPAVLVFGDSHAADKAWAMRSAGIQVGNLGGAGCPLAPDPKRKPCMALMEMAVDLAQQGRIKGLVLAQLWSQEEVAEDELQRIAEFWRQAGVPILIFTPTPTWVQIRNRIPRYSLPGHSVDEISYDADRLSAAERSVTLFARDHGFALVNTREMFCGSRDGECPAFVDQQPLLIDDEHLSTLGAQRMGQRIAESAVWQSWVASLKK